MRYPVISLSRCDELAQERIAGSDPGIDMEWTGDGEEVDLSRIAEAAQQIDALWRENQACSNQDQIEARAASLLYGALRPNDPTAAGVPDIAVLDDPGFWRYLGLRYFWDFVNWRQPNPFTNGKHMQVLDGTNPRDTVVSRMYLRFSSVGGLDYESEVLELENATDFWQSHIFNVPTASSVELTRAMVDEQLSNRERTADLRRFAKRLNAVWTNVLLSMYSKQESAMLLDELREELKGGSK